MEPSHIFFIQNKNLLNPQTKVAYQQITMIDLNESIKY